MFYRFCLEGVKKHKNQSCALAPLARPTLLSVAVALLFS